MAVLWRRVIIQEYKLERLKEVVDIESDWESVDEAINRILFSDEIHRMLDDDDDGDDRGSEDDDESRLPWDAYSSPAGCTCVAHVPSSSMSVMIQVRNVPESLHRELVHRADLRGQSLTAYVQDILEREVSRPPRTEIVRRIMEREPVKLDVPIADLIREGRYASPR